MIDFDEFLEEDTIEEGGKPSDKKKKKAEQHAEPEAADDVSTEGENPFAKKDVKDKNKDKKDDDDDDDDDDDQKDESNELFEAFLSEEFEIQTEALAFKKALPGKSVKALSMQDIENMLGTKKTITTHQHKWLKFESMSGIHWFKLLQTNTRTKKDIVSLVMVHLNAMGGLSAMIKESDEFDYVERQSSNDKMNLGVKAYKSLKI